MSRKVYVRSLDIWVAICVDNARFITRNGFVLPRRNSVQEQIVTSKFVNRALR